MNVVGPGGQTPLHAVGNYECAILLLAAGAEVDQRVEDGQTACNRATAMLGPRPRLASLGVDRGVFNRKSIYALLGAGARIDAIDGNGRSVKQILAALSQGGPVDSHVETARRDISKTRLDFVRSRALQVCIGLQSLNLDALQMCEILVHACGPLARLIAFHHWWKIATTVKHFKSRRC